MAKHAEFQRLFMMAEPEILSLNAQAALGAVHPPQRSQFSLLVRHFLERFFNHETASPDGDAKGRLILIAVATGIPGFMVALYLWPVYHPFIAWPPGRPLNADPPPYWLQVNHHFFFVLYSFVAMGIVTVFEWDLFFPDLLDVFVLTTLPIHDRKLFQARVAAIAIFVVGFLLDANLLAPLVLPASFDPPNLPRLLLGHILAVLAAGLFSAVFILALQGALLAFLGERLFRRFSLILQGLSISALLMLLLLFPVLSAVVPVFLQSGSRLVRYCPPFWFLGIYQRLLEGPSALPIYTQLVQTGCAALLITVAVAALAYPFAYLRRVRQLVVGPGTHDTRTWAARPLHSLLHATLVRPPVRRAVFHFISQTLLRVQRYRIYLVLYGGVGLSVLVASVLRLTVTRGQVELEISADGVRAAIAIAAFWTVAGLRMAFVSPGNRQGSWVFRIVHGRPPRLSTALHQLQAAKLWVLLWAAVITFGVGLVLRALAPPELRTGSAAASLGILAAALCLLLTDLLFLSVNTVAFTGEPAREQPNLAMTLLKYFTFLPILVWIPVATEPWIEASPLHFALAAALVAGAHFVLRSLHRRVIREHCNMPGLEDDEDDFPMKLGLRY
ncbi:MAG: hypothetical protein P4L26_03505 [Terracidiphilus sp.]|nr:hypothetical protein [Terracidiphilus sp.]